MRKRNSEEWGLRRGGLGVKGRIGGNGLKRRRERLREGMHRKTREDELRKTQSKNEQWKEE